MIRNHTTIAMSLLLTLAGACADEHDQTFCSGDDDNQDTSDQASDGLGCVSLQESALLAQRPNSGIRKVTWRVDPPNFGIVNVQSENRFATCRDSVCYLGARGKISLHTNATTQTRFVDWTGCAESTESTIEVRTPAQDVECVAHYVPGIPPRPTAEDRVFCRNLYSNQEESRPIEEQEIGCITYEEGAQLAQQPDSGVHKVTGRVDPPQYGILYAYSENSYAICSDGVCYVSERGEISMSTGARTQTRFVNWTGCIESEDSHFVLSAPTEDVECVANYVPGISPETGK
jgi:hypothetical protein